MIPKSLIDVHEIPAEITGLVKESVINTFASIIGSEPDYVEQSEQASSLNGIIGNIAVFNQHHTLSLMIVIPRETALKLSEIFIGVEIPFESDDMGDLVGEISNILAGDVAANVETVGFRGQSSLPTATRGSDLTLFLPNKPPTEKMKFTGFSGDFWVNMALSESR
jgi:CheY-specific phosphatase CheX